MAVQQRVYNNYQNSRQRRTSSSANEVVPELKCELDGQVRHLKRERYLGKGSFAVCFQFEDRSAGKSYAAKIVTRNVLKDKRQYDKVVQEAAIHIGLDHPNVVKLFDYYELNECIYMFLELCSERSMMELQRTRQTVTEIEARYFLAQIVDGVSYLHSKKIIHRDLKLGNLLVTDKMEVKIADFGLAIRESQLNECRLEKCGTPNYISPEMLLRLGHSYPVDIWSIGIVMYTLVGGTPPFETDSMEATYNRIKGNIYTFSPAFGRCARSLIRSLLSHNPHMRPKANQIRQHEFFSRQECPKQLPFSAMVASPRVNQALASETIQIGSRTTDATETRDLYFTASTLPVSVVSANETHNIPAEFALRNIIAMLDRFDAVQPTNSMILRKEDEYPAGRPIFWITRWVDVTSKFGISYQMSNASIGFLFNDKTKLVIGANGIVVQYIDAKDNESYFNVDELPDHLKKKFSLLKSMRDFMLANLMLAGQVMYNNNKPTENEELERWPSISKWFVEERPELVASFCTSDGTFQVNFKQPHVKVIISSTLAAVTFILDNECFTYKLSTLCVNTLPLHILNLLKRIKPIAVRLLNL